MNELLVPEVGLFQILKDLIFKPRKVSMSSVWWASPIFVSVIVGAVVSQIFCRITGDNFLLTGLLCTTGFYTGCILAVKGFRKKIIADMKAAKPFDEVYGFRGYSINFNTQHVVIVPTMAGDLKFKGFDSIPNIQKKAGQLFDYYVFNNVEDLDQRDLSKFIAVPNDLG